MMITGMGVAITAFKRAQAPARRSECSQTAGYDTGYRFGLIENVFDCNALP